MVIIEDFNASRPWCDTVLPVASRSFEPSRRFWIHGMNRERKSRRAFSQPSVLRALHRLQLWRLVRTMPKHDVISFRWQVLSQPQLVDGPSASSPAAALHAPHTATGQCHSLSQQLQLKMLAEWLEPKQNRDTLKEQKLLERFCRVLPAGRTLFRVPDACCSISVAQRTVGQTCESLDSLTYLRLSTELRCPRYLRSIRQCRPTFSMDPS